jgi:hypothetical protein
MKGIIAGICGMALSSVLCPGQTNNCTSASLGFSLPPLRLSAEIRAESEKAATLSQSTPAALPVQNVALQSSLADTDFQSRFIRSGEFYLTRAESPSDSGLVRFVEKVFTPEVVHIGKVPIACSVVTAIKRKNPLCLLNPIVFQMSW